MKKFFTLCISMAAFGFAAQAQLANAVVFSENGEKFTLYLNGEAQNTTPQANVKVKDLTGEFYQARVDFADASLADITNNNFVVHKGFEATYKIKANNKGVYVLRWQSESALSGSTASAPASETVVEDYAIVEEEVEIVEEKAPAKSTPNGVNISMNTNVDGTNANQDVVIEETTTTTTTTSKPSKTTTTPTTGEKVNVNMNVGGVNMGINMNVEGMDMEVEESSSTTVTTTTTTTTKTAPAQPAKPAPAPAPAPRQEVVVVEKTTGCGKAMDAASFNTAKSSISSKGFDDTRLTVAKQVAKSNCLSTSQIKEIMGIFGFEETKLDFAKYAYDYCTDQGNYYLINDAFSFDSTIDELNQYIESK